MWVTHKENADHAKKLDLYNRDLSHFKKPVNQFDFNKKFIRRYESVTLASNITGISNISRACTTSLKNAGGYYWSYNQNI